MMPGSALAKGTLLAAGTFLGTVIGVGVFGLPFLASRMGPVPLIFLFAVLTPMIIIIHQRFAAVVQQTNEPMRIPGYVASFLGPRWGMVSRLISCLGLMGSLLAYLVIGGTFAALTLQPLGAVPVTLATLVFFLLGSALIVRGAHSVAWVDLVMIAGFFVVVGIFFFLSLPKLDTSLFHLIHWPETASGYGVVLFSLWGLSLVPETVELAGRNKRSARRILRIGILAAAVTYILFFLMVLGVTGRETTPDALTGFLQHFSPWVIVLGGVLGVLSTFTSYIALGMTLKKTLHFDVGVSDRVAILLTLAVPLGLYVVGLKNFLDVIGLTGAFLLGCDAIFILLVADRFHAPKEPLRIRKGSAVLLAVLVLGMLAELWSFLR